MGFLNLSGIAYIQQPITGGVIRAIEGLVSDDSDKRLKAVEALRRTKHPRVIKALIASLGDPWNNRDRPDSLAVRRALVLALVAMGKPAVNPLIEAVKTTSDEDDLFKTRSCIQALGRIGDKRAVPVLIERLDTWEGQWAVEALIRIGDERAIRSLLSYLNRLGRNFFWSPTGPRVAEKLFLDCGHPALEEAVHKWARDNNLYMVHNTRPVIWGSGNDTDTIAGSTRTLKELASCNRQLKNWRVPPS